jgi:hypothetical protein
MFGASYRYFILISGMIPPATHGADFFSILKASHGKSVLIEDFSGKSAIINVFIVKLLGASMYRTGTWLA